MKAHRIRCSEIWGGTGALDQDLTTQGLSAGIHSAAAGGGRGGDIYYLSVCSSDLLTRIAVADVRGHGESVTLVSSWVYDALQAQMNTLAGDQVLSDLNSTIRARGFEAMTTAVVISYYINNANLYFCYAGHPPAMVWRSGKGWQRLENLNEQQASNLPLGVLTSAVYEQGQVPLSSGDRVLMFTDGLLDAEDLHGEPFGEERLIRVLQEEGDTSIPSVKRAVLGSLFDWTRGLPLEDDLTVLAAEIREASGTRSRASTP